MAHERKTRQQAGRRGRSVLTAGVLAAALMMTAACSDDESESEEPDSEGMAASDEVTIRFSWWGNEDRAAITNEAVAAFMEEFPNITVETDYVDFDAYFDRLSTSVAAGEEPDVITMGGAYPREYGDRGVLLDLAEVADVIEMDKLDETALANGYFSDVQYGIPTGVNTYGLIINPALFEQAGVQIPDDDSWSWDDFVSVANELAAALPEGTYAVEDPTVAETLDLYANQATGTGLYTEDGEVALAPETAQAWWEMTVGLMGSGATPTASETAELVSQSGPEQTLMGRGLAAMKFSWSNMLGAFAEPAGVELQMLRAPGETTQEGPGQWLQASQLYTISANSDAPEAAAQLVNFLVTSTAAADLIGSDRGIPANAELREYLEPTLDAQKQIEFAYVDRISGVIDGDLIIGPTGSTETAGILTRLNDAVLFGQTSPADASEQLVSEIADAIENAA